MSPRPRLRLTVMRLENMFRVHPDQDNSHHCSQCGEQVGIYPSGQDILREYPDALIVCHVCIVREPIDVVAMAPGAQLESEESLDAVRGVPAAPSLTRRQRGLLGELFKNGDTPQTVLVSTNNPDRFLFASLINLRLVYAVDVEGDIMIRLTRAGLNYLQSHRERS